MVLYLKVLVTGKVLDGKTVIEEEERVQESFVTELIYLTVSRLKGVRAQRGVPDEYDACIARLGGESSDLSEVVMYTR